MTELKEPITENGIDFALVGDYYIPLLEYPKEDRPIGRWGRMRKRYLKEHRPILYNHLILTGELWTHLVDVNEQAAERLDRIIDQMAHTEGITEQLKATDQLGWVRRMNSIRDRAEEIILAELIYN